MSADSRCEGRTPGAVDVRSVEGIILSVREQQVLTLTAKGKTAAQVAKLMFLSERTVNFHIAKAVAKLGASNKTAAVAIAIRAGWI